MNAVTTFSEKIYLWNPTPIGESIVLGNSQDRLIKVACSERSLRLAHKHLLQCSRDDFHGFLLGSIDINEDGSEILINLDRFDPGTTSKTDGNLPSIAFPSDVVVPFKVVKNKNNHINFNNKTKEHFCSAIEMLQDIVQQRLPVELSRVFAISLHCIYSDEKPSDDTSINLQFYWNAVFISTLLEIFLVKNVPIIPTALAKTLANSIDFIQEDSIKTGIMTMDKTRKLLLMLDSDPKISTVTAVGVWISYVSSVYHPAVWLTCLRFLSHSFYKKVFSEENEFLLVVYSVPNSQPTFYKCSADQFDALSFDIVTAEHFLSLKNQSYQNSRMINVTLDYSPSVDDECRVAFDAALRDHFSEKQSVLKKEKSLSSQNNSLSTPPRSHSRASKSNDSASKDNPDYEPSPAPKPITRSIPILPSVLEPSMIINESSNVAEIAESQPKAFVENSTSGIPVYSYQRDLNDDLVPSFYGENQVYDAAARFCPTTNDRGLQRKPPDSNLNPQKLHTPLIATKITRQPVHLVEKRRKRSRPTNQSNYEEASGDFLSSQQPWFKSLPLVARKFYLVQEQRFKALMDQFTQLRIAVDSNAKKATETLDMGVQVQIDETCPCAHQSVGVNTEEILISNVIQSNSSSQTDPFTNESEVLESESPPDEAAMRSSGSTPSTETPIPTPNKANGTVTGETSNKGDSEFSSIQLNSSALNTSNNNPSLVSSLKAVDLPVLDSTTDNTSTPHALDLLSQNSPVLGESASMYLTNKNCHSVKDRLASETEEDQEFFGNLLKQVQEMLDKGDGNVETKKSFIPDYPISTLKCDRTFPSPLVPHFANLGVTTNRGILDNYNFSSLLESSSGHELSMHANAIAMKYLTDDQLASIAAHSADEPTVQVLSQTTSSRLSVSEKFTGLSLLSPANMSLATKKYMKKYGLVTLEEESDDNDDKENVLPIEKKQNCENFLPNQNEDALAKSNEKKNLNNLKGLRRDDDDDNNDKRSCSISSKSGQTDSNRSQDPGTRSGYISESGWSHLKDNLGETFDMLLPFLSDLQKNQQANPPGEHHVGSGRSRDKDAAAGSGETVEQILSPRILKTIKRANQKFERKLRKENSVPSKLNKESSRSSFKKNSIRKAHSYSQESHVSVPDAPSKPPCSGKARSVDLTSPRDRACSVDRILRHKRSDAAGNHRRLSSSPTRSRKYSNKHRNTRKVSYERVLNSQIMQAFHKDPANESSDVRSSSSVADEEENILNIQRIKSLQKLS